MSKRYAKAPSLFFDTPLALLPAKRDEIIAFWDIKLRGGALEWEGDPSPIFEALIQDSPESAEEESRPGSKIAILPLYGVISQRMNMMTAMSGGTSTDLFAQEFLKVLHDPEIGAIIIDIDSPGGSTFGVSELSNLIMESRGQKPIVAYASPLAASAAFWIGTAADHFFAEPSALVGSVGVYTVHTDLSQAAENEGVKVTYISAGKNKTRGNEFAPLSEDDQRYLQSIVDDAYDMFVGDVARGRRVTRAKVLKDYGEGDVFTASKALEAGMIDGLRSNLGEVIASLPALRSRRPVPKSLAAQSKTLEVKLDPEQVKELEATIETNKQELLSSMAESRWIIEGAIPLHNSVSIADEDSEYDAEHEIANANSHDALEHMHVWVKDANYIGPHHKANGELVPQGLHAVAQQVNDLDVPDEDRAGIRRHLARHYAELNATPPWETEEQEARLRNWRSLQWQSQKAQAEAFSATLSREEE